MVKESIICILCNKVVKGGINRFKKHIAHISGDIAKCPNVTPEDKQKVRDALNLVKQKKNDKEKEQEEIRNEVNLCDDFEKELEDVEVGGSRKKKAGYLGPIDVFTKPIDVESSERNKITRQPNINDALFKQRTHQVHHYMARWVYEAGIPFNAIDNNNFKRFCQAVGKFGEGYQPATQYMLREQLLNLEVDDTKASLKKYEDEWAKTGCSLMTDAWSDRKRRSIMNVCFNCREGTVFLSSKEASNDAHTSEYIFNYVHQCIEDIGSDKVVQVVTDNASNNMGAATMLKKERPDIFWTSCATHTLNLMLQDIAKLQQFKTPIQQAKSFTLFIYSHHKTLALMRKYIENHDIVRPGVTRFASCFLTLQSLENKKSKLRTMMTSGEWDQCQYSKSKREKTAYKLIVNTSFWNGINLCIKVFEPLVKVLRLVDGDKKPSMAFLYGELEEAKEEIRKVFKHVERSYKPILDIVNAKGKSRLDTPLHMTAYLLNPFYLYKNESISQDTNVTEGFYTCLEKFFPDDFQSQEKVANIEYLKYKRREGAFGREIVIRGCQSKNFVLALWWSNYGNATPLLCNMAMRILSLTSSSSGCERNWSTFEGIHTKKRNKLDVKRLNKLVYVQFNSKLFNKKKK